MTERESPSALLERAAAAVEFFAKQASPGPWSIGLFGHLVCDANGEAVASNIGNEADDRWIKAMSPAVAPPLVEWLRKTAQHFAGMDEVQPLDPAVLAQRPGQYGYEAVSFARAVLGET